MRFIRTVALAVVGLLAASWIAIAVSNKARLFVAKHYFRHERQEWTPKLAQLGILRPVRMQLEPGVSLNLDPRDLVSVSLLRTHEWQPEVWDSLKSRLKPGGVLLDVGAHIGTFSLKGAAIVGAKGRVVSFEPNPETLAELRSNVAASHAESVVTVEPIACSDRDQELTLYASRGVNTGGSSLSKDNAGAFDVAPKAYPVRARPIDEVVAELGLQQVDAMKIDVEGAEVSVLRGAAKTLAKFHPKVVIEIDERQLAGFGTTPADVESVFRAAGYNQRKKLDEDDWEWYCLCPENTASFLKAGDPGSGDQLLSGFSSIEQGAWRWTGKEFVVALAVPPGSSILNLDLTVPQVLLDRVGGSTRLQARIGKKELAPQTFSAAGNATYRRDLPVGTTGVVEVHFTVDKALPPSGSDPRVLGLIVRGASVQ